MWWSVFYLLSILWMRLWLLALTAQIRPDQSHLVSGKAFTRRGHCHFPSYSTLETHTQGEQVLTGENWGGRLSYLGGLALLYDMYFSECLCAIQTIGLC